jgi:membrane-associated protein
MFADPTYLPSGPPMNEFFANVWGVIKTIVVNLRNPEKWQEVLNQPGVFWPAVAALAAIIFAETGLFVGFFLPGDSLLVTVGIVARMLTDTAAANGEPSSWNIWVLMAVLIVAAICGDNTGYWFGAKAGPALFNRPKSRWFKREYLLKAREFFEEHGGKAVVLARFMPFARTFVPIVAGAARMNYRWFLTYSVTGGVLWISSMLLFGYYAVDFLEPALQKVFGPQFRLREKIDVLALVIVALSLTPLAIHKVLDWRKKRREAKEEPVVAGKVGD